MPRLRVIAPRLAHTSFPLAGGAILGRSPECEIVLAHASVSRQHARIARDGDDWVLADLGSRNGTRLNGRRIERARLADSDELELGEVRLKLELAASPRPEESAVPGETLEFAEELVLPAAPAGGTGGAIEIEGEELLAETAVRPRAATPRPAPAFTGAQAQALPAGTAAALDPATARRVELVRQLRAERPSGWFGGDWEQLPGLLRLAVIVAGIVLAAGAAWGAFALVKTLRGA